MKIVRLFKAPMSSPYYKYFGRLALVIPSEIKHEGMIQLQFYNGEKEMVAERFTRPYRRYLPLNDTRTLFDHEMKNTMRQINHKSVKLDNLCSDPTLLLKIELKDPEANEILSQIEALEKEIQKLYKSYYWVEFEVKDINEEEILMKFEKIYEDKSKRDFWNSGIGQLPTGTEQFLF